MATIDTHYLYSIGRIKELEKGLLSETNRDRVLEAEDPLAVLRGLGFFKSAEDHEKVESVQELFVKERQANQKQFHELVADSPLEDIFLLPHDIENIKFFLKAKLTGKTALKNTEVEEGKFSKTELLQAIFEELPTSIPTSILDDIKSLTEEFQTSRRFSHIDIRLDQRLRTMQLSIARNAKSRFMIEYFQRLSDVQNIATTIRMKFHQSGREILRSHLFEDGTLDIQMFERVYDGGWESMITVFKPTAYDKVVTAVIEDVGQESFFSRLDVSCANYLIEFLQDAKRMGVGIEPVLAFCLAWDHALKAVCIILAGRFFRFPHDKLLQRMRKLYQ